MTDAGVTRGARKHIGGFLELELPGGAGPLHPQAIALQTGRACLAAILAHERPSRVHLPFFICGAVVDEIRSRGIACEFYSIDEAFAPLGLPEPRRGELLLVVNYFGLQSRMVRAVADRFEAACVVDNTHAFFDPGAGRAWSFCSARKFFGVPDGAYLHAPEPVHLSCAAPAQRDISHLVNRMQGRQELAFRQFRRAEARMTGDMRQMSVVSARLLGACDYAGAAAARRENYLALHRALHGANRMAADLPDDAVPYCYPLLLERHVARAALAERWLYVPTLWPEVIDSTDGRFAKERELATRLLPLPVDQRYTVEDMQVVLDRLKSVGVLGSVKEN